MEIDSVVFAVCMAIGGFIVGTIVEREAPVQYTSAQHTQWCETGRVGVSVPCKGNVR